MSSPAKRNKPLPLVPLVLALVLTLALAWAGTSWASLDRPGTDWYVDMSRMAGSAHASLKCQDCHSQLSQAGQKHPDPQDPAYLRSQPQRDYDYSRCQACHRTAYKRYLQGAHAKALQEQRAKPGQAKQEAPTCGHCHDSHYQPAHRDRLTVGREMTRRCGNCHQAQELTYLQNFHGKAAHNLGNIKAAFCSDCHGAHSAVSLKDRQAALKACQRCHDQAQASFAGVVIHPSTVDLKPQDQQKRAQVRVIVILSAIMAILVGLVVLLFYSHGLVWMLREIHHKLRKR